MYSLVGPYFCVKEVSVFVFHPLMGASEFALLGSSEVFKSWLNHDVNQGVETSHPIFSRHDLLDLHDLKNANFV